MKYKEIFLKNIENNRIQLIQSIQEKGIELAKSSKTIKRRDLVEYLNEKHDYEIKDGLIIDQLVKEAYNNSGYSESLQKSLINNIENNNSNNKVYNPERVYIQPTCWEFNENKLTTDLNIISKAQNSVLKEDGIELINNAVKNVELISIEKTISLTGELKVEVHTDYAKNIKKGYKHIINTYENVKNKNLDLISDFEDVRNELKIIREDILNLLIDIFGNSIKTTEPELFNFSKINWIDFEETWDKLNLFYNDINQQLEIFKNFHSEQMENISVSSKESVNSFFKNTDTLLKKNGSISNSELKGTAISSGVGFLVNSGISVLKSRSEAKKTVAVIKRDVEKLKSGMKDDIELLLNDTIRLGFLQTEIKDKLLPQLKIFISQIYKNIDTNITPIYNKIIEDKNIKELRNSNIILTTENRKIEIALIDEKNQMIFSKKNLLFLENFIQNNSFEYEYLKKLHPIKPKGLYKFLSPKKSKVLFEETLNDWNKYCKPKKEEYENILKKHQNELNLQQQINTDIQLLTDRKKEIEKKLNSNSNKISQLFKVSPINSDLLKNLIVNTKEIVSSSKGVLEVGLKEQLLTI